MWRVLALVAAAGFGYLLAQGGSPGSTNELATPVTTSPGTPAPEAGSSETERTTSSLPRYGEEPAATDLDYEITAGFDPAIDRLYLLSIPIGRSAFDPELISLGQNEPVERRLGSQSWNGIGAPSLQSPGEDRHPLTIASDGVAIVTLDGVLFQEGSLAEQPRNLGPGIAVLSGPDADSVWILGTAERTARLVNVTDSTLDITANQFDISDVGRPLASASDGLVFTPRGSPDRDNFYWTPDSDPEPFVGSAGAEFLGADGDTVVYGTADSMLVYDTNSPDEARTVPLPIESPLASSVSPGGDLIALSLITPLTDPNIVVIVDLSTGEVVSEIKSALQYQYRWSGPDTLLYLLPEWPAFRLVERDTVDGTDRNLLRFPSLDWWYNVDRTARGDS